MSDYRKPKRNTSESGFMLMIEKALGGLIDKLFSRGAGFAVFPSGELTKRWAELESHDPKLAVLEADKLVDEVLKRAGLAGESMAERLRRCENLTDRMTYQEMWDAHKLRNQLAHEVDHRVDGFGLQDAMRKMKKFLLSLGAFKND